MPQQSTGFMQALDRWSQENILDPLYEAWRAVEHAPDSGFEEECQQHLDSTVLAVKKAIREKVLESYRNGQKVPASKAAPRKFARK